METIEIILKYVYESENISPPKIPRNYMKAILILCTTQSPFYSADGSIYQQIDGVSMGCVLGPTMANYYMGHLEETVLNKEIRAPNLFDHWVEDIFIDA